MKKALFIFLLTFCATAVLHAQQPVVTTSKDSGWHKIGDAKVDFKTDKDKFIVIGRDRFKAIKVKVMDAPVRIDELQIDYDGDIKETVTVGADLNPGSESNVFTLKNNNADLDKVSFVYKTVGNARGEKARIELWGQK